MDFIDLKYIIFAGRRLNRFHKVSDTIYNFRCPYCGDSKHNPNKARGFLFVYEHEWIYKCHNCGKSTNLPQLLKYVDPVLYNEYQFTKFSKKSESSKVEEKIEFVKKTNLDGVIPKIAHLQSDHSAKTYLKNRKIPDSIQNEWYFCNDLNLIKNIFEGYSEVEFRKDDRIIIPFLNEYNETIGITARAINKVKNSERYVILKNDSNSPMIYGLNKINRNVTINVVEGPIDSVFLPNCIAVGGSDLQRVLKILPSSRMRFIMDNQPRNREVVNKIAKLIDMNCDVVIWPSEILQKDINQMIIDGIDPNKLIEENTYRGLSAKLKLSNWRKC